MFKRTEANARAVSLHPASQYRDLTATSYTGKEPLNEHPLLAQGPGECMLRIIFPRYRLPAIEEKIEQIFQLPQLNCIEYKTKETLRDCFKSIKE